MTRLEAQRRSGVPHTFAQLPVALQAAVPSARDASIEVELLERSAAKDGSGATTSVGAVRAELAEHERLLRAVPRQQPPKPPHEDERVIIEEHDPLRAPARECRRAPGEREGWQKAVLRGERLSPVC